MSDTQRWYDKDNDLSLLFSFLETIDERNRVAVANDILQIIFKELNIDCNQKVSTLKSLTYDQKKRWYDDNIDVQSSVELIKDLTPNVRHDLLVRIIDDLEQIYVYKGLGK